MKIILSIILTLSVLTGVSDSQWQVISNQGNEALAVPVINIGYSTANGITKKTTNGGFNWSTLSGGNLTGIFFINDITGWVVGYPGYIGYTTNGSSFVQQQTGVTDRLNDVFFIDPNTGWVVGGDFSVERIFKTTNAGANWISQTSGTANKLFSVYFLNASTGYSVGGPSSPKIIKTTDGGTTWLSQYTNISTPLYSVMFADVNTGWAVAGYIGGETIIKTTNGGTNWFSQSSGDNRYLRACFVLNSNKAFAVGQSGKMICTTNGGNNWFVQSTGSSVELWSVKFANDTIGYAIGDNVVLKTANGGLAFVEINNNRVPDNFLLYQNYPNPFNPTTIIRYGLPRSSQVSIKIYNSSGDEVSAPVDKIQGPGVHEIVFNGIGLSSGVYFYKIVAGDFISTKKMVLLK